MRVLSGIQSSGKLHIGNYLGAIKQYIELQDQHECFYFIANYHSLTTVRDAEALRQHTLDVAMDFLALGLDPNKAALFRQSDIPEVTELAWILATVTNEGLMRRAHSYKDKIAKGFEPTMGLMSYPILMAADILIYRANLVPVGKDQVQHLEITQDIATKFNMAFGKEILERPEPRLNAAPVVPGVDGAKMSKSYGNTIEIFDTPKKTKKRIMSIKTDSTPVEDPKDPENCTVMALMRALASPEEVTEWEKRYREGGMGYGDVKKRLAEIYEDIFGEARERRAELEAHPEQVEEALVEGAKKARKVTCAVMDEVRDACGLVRAKEIHG